jgi:hypothetical protein
MHEVGEPLVATRQKTKLDKDFKRFGAFERGLSAQA